MHLIFHEDQRTNELEQLIATWANTAEGQVFDGQGLWVAQIGRYRQVNGAWTKHHRELQVPSIFNLPLTMDGNETQTLQFSVIGFLCHSGTAHQEGHFFAVFVYRGLYWLVDDGAYPKAIQDSVTRSNSRLFKCGPSLHADCCPTMWAVTWRKNRADRSRHHIPNEGARKALNLTLPMSLS